MSAKKPQWDMRIRRKGGYQWASETDVEGLRFWVEKNASSTDPRWAEKNQKDARSLSFWLAWREENPTELWQGERSRQQVTASAPLPRPMIHEWEPRPTSDDIFSQPDKPATEPATDPDDFDRAL